jgi:Protein of unknown function (DUF2971)
MANIACLGWGSLVWNPGGLPIRGSWLTTGPQVCVDFLRQSRNGRITLVLDSKAEPVQAHWAMMTATETPHAVTALRQREDIPLRHEKRDIGVWRPGEPPPKLIPDLASWATEQKLDAVIWTNLGPKFNDEPRAPTIEEVVSYLTSLTGQKRHDAEEYVRKAPVDTPYRRKILETFGQENSMPRFKFVDRKAHPHLYHWQKFNAEHVTTLLRDNVIWFSNPMSFNDPWDCKPYFNSDFVNDPVEVEKHVQSYAAMTRRRRKDITEEFIAQRQKEFRDNPKFLAECVEKISAGIGSEIANRYRVYCLAPDVNNLLMWAHYAESHKGICLEFSTENEMMCAAQMVEYREEFPVLAVYNESEDDNLVPLLTKSDAWKYESEYRLVAQERSNSTPHDTLMADNNFVKLPKGALKSIIVGCQGSVEDVRKLVKEFAPDIQVRQAIRVPNKYAVRID